MVPHTFLIICKSHSTCLRDIYLMEREKERGERWINERWRRKWEGGSDKLFTNVKKGGGEEMERRGQKSRGGRGRRKAAKKSWVRIGAVRACSGVVPVNTLTNRTQVGMLGQHPSKQGDATHQHFFCGVEVGPIHQVKGQGWKRSGNMGLWLWQYKCKVRPWPQ